MRTKNADRRRLLEICMIAFGKGAPSKLPAYLEQRLPQALRDRLIPRSTAFERLLSSRKRSRTAKSRSSKRKVVVS